MHLGTLNSLMQFLQSFPEKQMCLQQVYYLWNFIKSYDFREKRHKIIKGTFRRVSSLVYLDVKSMGIYNSVRLLNKLLKTHVYGYFIINICPEFKTHTQALMYIWILNLNLF